eukprot:9469359-Pyramimonas_sp.AAC.1
MIIYGGKEENCNRAQTVFGYAFGNRAAMLGGFRCRARKCLRLRSVGPLQSLSSWARPVGLIAAST